MTEEEVMAYRWLHANRALRHGSWRAANFFILAIVGMICSASCYGKSLVVQSGGNAVSQGQTLSINTIPNMPNLVLSVNGGTACDTVSYEVEVEYTGQDGWQTGAVFTADGYYGDQAVTIDWLGIQEGGNATISWVLNGVQQPAFGFIINGLNPPPTVVDAYLSGGPWFIRSMVSWESEASYTNWTYYQQFYQGSPFGYPLWGTPHGY